MNYQKTFQKPIRFFRCKLIYLPGNEKWKKVHMGLAFQEYGKISLCHFIDFIKHNPFNSKKSTSVSTLYAPHLLIYSVEFLSPSV